MGALWFHPPDISRLCIATTNQQARSNLFHQYENQEKHYILRPTRQLTMAQGTATSDTGGTGQVRQQGYDHAPTRDDTDVIGARIGAQIADSIAMGVIFAVGFYGLLFVGGLLGTQGDASSAGVFGLLGLVIGGGGMLFYWFLLEGVWDGQTLGKRLFGIKVVKENGEECSIGAAVVRNLLEIIDGFAYYLVGFIAMAVSDKRQRVGDRLAGTVVVKAD